MTGAVEDVVITATKTEEEILEVPEHVTIVNAEQIQASGARNLGDVLEGHTGISITDYGPEGSVQSVSVRGSTSSQVLVLIDGVRQNSASSGSADLSLIPIDNIERIEIVRGGSSALSCWCRRSPT